MQLTGTNIFVLDLETARIAEDCRHCGKEETQHFADGACFSWHGERPASSCTQFSALGWNNKSALGLSIGCWWSYVDSRIHWFDVHTLEETVSHFVERQPLLVSFNGIQFDFALMRGLMRVKPHALAADGTPGPVDVLCDAFKALCATSYDILAEIWKVDPSRKFERGLNSLNAISQANGRGRKKMDGATAPRLWAQGRYAEVLNYCQGDVIKTRQLFEQIVETGEILRSDGQPIRLRTPPLGVVAA